MKRKLCHKLCWIRFAKKIRYWRKPKSLRNLSYLLSYSFSTVFSIFYVLNEVFHDLSWFFQIPGPKFLQVVLMRLRQRIYKIFTETHQVLFCLEQIKPVLEYLIVLNYYEQGCTIFYTIFNGLLILLASRDKWKLFQ